MPPNRQKILIVDDNPTHLEIYELLVKQAGYEPVPALVSIGSPKIPHDHAIGLVLLNYNLNSARSPVEIAQELQGLYPFAPIVLLSDGWGLPNDVAPYVTAFVRKGASERILRTIALLLPGGENARPSGQESD
ncbi:MAG TPA: response regulator [Terracidiphilus sp.]|nr:response regulator [Terracidiphilus sp.]